MIKQLNPKPWLLHGIRTFGKVLCPSWRRMNPETRARHYINVEPKQDFRRDDDEHEK